MRKSYASSIKLKALWVYLVSVSFPFVWAKAWEFRRESREFQRKANLCPGSDLLLQCATCVTCTKSRKLKWSFQRVLQRRTIFCATIPMEIRVIFHFCCCSFLVPSLPVSVNYLQHREVFKVHASWFIGVQWRYFELAQVTVSAVPHLPNMTNPGCL